MSFGAGSSEPAAVRPPRGRGLAPRLAHDKIDVPTGPTIAALVLAGAAGATHCARHDCGGVVPVSWCAEHGDAVGPVMEWHPGGGIRCTDLLLDRTGRDW
ncbi:hypothetical protein [Streptomyces sp. NPDC059949]|uniref:hypothetical protein n=1 Tax=Streptomyces sp. NPDC059949 TaxID=3347013 RepID=UPI00365A9DB8